MRWTGRKLVTGHRYLLLSPAAVQATFRWLARPAARNPQPRGVKTREPAGRAGDAPRERLQRRRRRHERVGGEDMTDGARAKAFRGAEHAVELKNGAGVQRQDLAAGVIGHGCHGPEDGVEGE